VKITDFIGERIMNIYIKNSLNEAKNYLDSLLNNESLIQKINDASLLLINTFKNNNRVFSCGNGGSMCDAIHFAEELTGRYRKNRNAFPAISISDIGHFSCVGNDYGYEKVFSRYLEAHGKHGDCLIAISTSGSSKNILHAMEYAKFIGMNIIGLTGHDNIKFNSLCTYNIYTPAGNFADRIQELHIKILHIFIELIERKFCTENYK
jgi:D-sedoheptulose 7-phosphate isomerase